MTSRLLVAVLATALLTSAANTPPAIPVPPIPPAVVPPPAAANGATGPTASTGHTAIAADLVTLAFDADPSEGTGPRQVLSRWAEPMRLAVFGAAPEVAAVRHAAAAIARATRLPIEVSTQDPRARPANAFLVIGPDNEQAFRGEFRALLSNVFLDNEALVDSFLTRVIDVQPCWTLPVWTDFSRLILKAAVIGIGTRQARPDIRRCITQRLAAALGLMGAGGSLPGSVFNPQTSVTELSRDDAAMLRVFYGPALRVGMTRAETLAAATEAFRHAPRLVIPPARPLARGAPSLHQ